MEQNRIPESLSVAEATGGALDALHLGVDGLTGGVGDPQGHGVDDAPQMLAARFIGSRRLRIALVTHSRSAAPALLRLTKRQMPIAVSFSDQAQGRTSKGAPRPSASPAGW